MRNLQRLVLPHAQSVSLRVKPSSHVVWTATRKCHVPVMPEEAISHFKGVNGTKFLDMTFGAGGHTKRILEEFPKSVVFALDRDLTAHETAKKLAKTNPRIFPLCGCFSDVHKLLARKGVGPGEIDGILFDVGASSMQFNNKDRGFALSQTGPLDMRMNSSGTGFGAVHMVNYLGENEIAKILKRYGEEKYARQIAKAIVDSRHSFGAISTTSQLAKVVQSAFDGSETGRRDKLNRHSHVATKTFQALRIFVNNELNELHHGLEIAYNLLKPGGVCVAISFHSLEDRIIKRHFHSIDIDAKENMTKCDQRRVLSLEEMEAYMRHKWKPVSKNVEIPTDEEVEVNPRSRSAKLRAAVKL